MAIYDNVTKTNTVVAAKHKKRVVCGDWNCEQKFAFASDDRQISVTNADGKTVGQVLHRRAILFDRNGFDTYFR